MDDQAAWALEERFWLEGVSLYEELLDPECLMVFPGMGVLRAARVLESLRSASRWTSVVMTERTLARPAETLMVLAYRAEGRRGDAAPYVAYCSSTYRQAGDAWSLVQHQQTPAG
jgi:hypothetical protein